MLWLTFISQRFNKLQPDSHKNGMAFETSIFPHVSLHIGRDTVKRCGHRKDIHDMQINQSGSENAILFLTLSEIIKQSRVSFQLAT